MTVHELHVITLVDRITGEPWDRRSCLPTDTPGLFLARFGEEWAVVTACGVVVQRSYRRTNAQRLARLLGESGLDFSLPFAELNALRGSEQWQAAAAVTADKQTWVEILR